MNTTVVNFGEKEEDLMAEAFELTKYASESDEELVYNLLRYKDEYFLTSSDNLIPSQIQEYNRLKMITLLAKNNKDIIAKEVSGDPTTKMKQLLLMHETAESIWDKIV